jgi:hypothetical protein
LYAGIVEIYVNNRIIILWLKVLYIGSKYKKTIENLSIPYPKHIRQKEKKNVCCEKRAHDQKDRDQDIAVFIGGQW